MIVQLHRLIVYSTRLSTSEPAPKVNVERERGRQSLPKSGVKLLFCVVVVVAVLLAAVAAAVPRMERWPVTASNRPDCCLSDS